MSRPEFLAPMPVSKSKTSVTTGTYIAFRQRMDDMEFIPATYSSWDTAIEAVHAEAIKLFKEMRPSATDADVERCVARIPERHSGLNKLLIAAHQPVPAVQVSTWWTFKIVRLT